MTEQNEPFPDDDPAHFSDVNEPDPDGYGGDTNSEPDDVGLESDLTDDEMRDASDEPLMEAALFYAGDRLADKAYAVQLAPDDSPLVGEVFREVQMLDLDDPDKLSILAGLAERENGEAAWYKAIQAAQEAPPVEQLGETVHPLEELAKRQTNSERVSKLADIAYATVRQPHMRARVLRAVAVQAARLNDAMGAAVTATHMEMGTNTPDDIYAQAAETVVGLTDVQARQRSPAAQESLDSLPEPYHSWGQIKVAKYTDSKDAPRAWAQANAELKNHWHEFSTRQHLDILKDLTDSGQLDMAAKLAVGMAALLNYSSPEERQAEVNVTTDIAAAQAASNPATGQATLSRLEAYVSRRLQATGKMRVPIEYSADQTVRQYVSPDEAKRYQNQIAGHRTGLLTLTDIGQARQAVVDYTPTGPHAGEYYAIVAKAFAAAGHADEAVALANRIPEDHEDSTIQAVNRSLKSRTFTDIARAAR